jgi:cellulose synthase/poly-beta-1,6-N-acetylglucosamine synthase-like glycosyltransferase
MLDGDSALVPGWIDTARTELQRDPRLAGVFGRMRERYIHRSIYNWLCDVEWSIPPGSAMAFGGGVMLRRSAVETIRYADDMIAAEDTEFSIRLRREGWQIRCLPAEMALHDAAIVSFGQWWRRMVRGGHGMAEMSARHFRSTLHDYDRRGLSILAWGLAWPAAAASSVTMAMIAQANLWAWVAAAIFLVMLAQFVRIGIRETRAYPAGKAFSRSFFLLIGKFPEAIGFLQYWRNRAVQRPPQLIEYKGASQANQVGPAP